MDYPIAFETYRTDDSRVEKWCQFFLSATQGINRDVLLDCGCGVGRFSIPLSYYFHDTYGIDINKTMLDIAQRKSCRVNWIHADAGHIPLSDKSVNAVLASMLIEHLDSLDAFLSEVDRLTKDEGILLLRTMLPSDIDNTQWYQFSEKARIIELERTRSLEYLEELCKKNGFILIKKHSKINVIENFYSPPISERLQSRCYEVLHHLDENEFNLLVSKAIAWEKNHVKEFSMSSSLLAFKRF